LVKNLRVVPGSPPELVVYDKPGPCPYFSDRLARLPLRLPARPLRREELDHRLQSGDRRQGLVLYRTACPACQACEPIRIDVTRFAPSRTHRRIVKRGAAAFRVQIGPPVADDRRVELYNRHKRGRGLTDRQEPIDIDGYRDFLGSTCCETFEIRYHVGEELAGVAVVDRGADALSAVYCYYDPSYEKLSPGTFSILKQLELCQIWGLRYLYLGLYIADSDVMRYKARFVPHERLLGGRWIETDD
jgi:arginine-tRNA-protein transferase